LIEAEQGLKVLLKSLRLNACKTTLALAVVQKHKLIIAHCGDSKVYVYRNQKPIFETKSHSYIEFLMDKGIISKEDAQNHPQKNALTRFVDGINPAQLDVTELEIYPNDLLLLCSDGVNEGIDVHQPLSSNQSVDEIAKFIQEQCIMHSNDNFTFILAQV
jgi:protein phosphatase